MQGPTRRGVPSIQPNRMNIVTLIRQLSYGLAYNYMNTTTLSEVMALFLVGSPWIDMLQQERGSATATFAVTAGAILLSHRISWWANRPPPSSRAMFEQRVWDVGWAATATAAGTLH